MAGRAPELLLGNRPTAAADVWALACVLYFILTGDTSPYAPSGVKLPEPLLNELIAAGDLDIATLEWALGEGADLGDLRGRGGAQAREAAAAQLLHGMLLRDPEARPSAAEVGEHPLWWTPEHAMQELLGLVADMKEEPRIKRMAEEDATLRVEVEPILGLGAEGSWRGRVPEALLQEKEQYSYYNTGRMADLLRFVRNVYEHPPEAGSDAWNSVKLTTSSSGRSHRGGHSRRLLTEGDHASWKKAVAYFIMNNCVPELPLIVYKWKAVCKSNGYVAAIDEGRGGMDDFGSSIISNLAPLQFE
eukprot:gene6739-8062_t